jgi:hypothetical protein
MELNLHANIVLRSYVVFRLQSVWDRGKKTATLMMTSDGLLQADINMLHLPLVPVILKPVTANTTESYNAPLSPANSGATWPMLHSWRYSSIYMSNISVRWKVLNDAVSGYHRNELSSVRTLQQLGRCVIGHERECIVCVIWVLVTLMWTCEAFV